MTLCLKTTPGLFNLHCSVGLTDWDMDRELKLSTTMDQFHYDEKPVKPPEQDEVMWYDESSDTYVKPNLWLLVNPIIACPIQYRGSAADLCALPDAVQEAALQCFAGTYNAPLQEEELLHPACSSPDYMIMVDSIFQSAKDRPRRRNKKAKVKKTLKSGFWPRPPVNYCILIALALKTGCLKVQQIYHFTREHFPFFQTAPDGWKNTIRHNLCFNSSFHKTVNHLDQNGKRKSCYWHLTLDGHQRLEDDLRMMKAETFRELERSMAHPDLIRSLLSQ